MTGRNDWSLARARDVAKPVSQPLVHSSHSSSTTIAQVLNNVRSVCLSSPINCKGDGECTQGSCAFPCRKEATQALSCLDPSLKWLCQTPRSPFLNYLVQVCLKIQNPSSRADSRSGDSDNGIEALCNSTSLVTGRSQGSPTTL
jgi:hypothetical protein